MDYEQHNQALRNVVDAILGKGGVGGSLPTHPNTMFHVEHSPTPSPQDSPLNDPLGYVGGMDSDDLQGYPQPPVDNLFHVEHSQDSPLTYPLGYSGVITNNKENNMTVTEALNALIEAISEQVVDSIKAEVEDLISDAISDHNSDYDHDDYVSRGDLRDIVEELLAGATITL